jgi:hypothetical protein
MASSSRILKALAEAVPETLQDPHVHATAKRLKLSGNVLFVCILVLIALAVVGRFMPRS